jgi:hypothetical protein
MLACLAIGFFLYVRHTIKHALRETEENANNPIEWGSKKEE